ncbi:MAG: methyltransferase domain-containing protein [Verrucomicrobia bacterium]|nr:methyltransferase domain-containing protein [Verrucomicrobiota bacterium]
MANDNASVHPAHRYDAEIRHVIPFYDAIQAETLDLVRSIAGEPLLWVDTGSGTGALIERALPAFPRTQFVLADPSEAMLTQARARFAGQPSSKITILPPTPSEGLPALMPRIQAQVVTAMLCHHYHDPVGRLAAVRGCFEILAPGGVLIVFENIDCDSVRGREIGLHRWREFQLRQGRTLADVETHLARFGTELKPIRIAEHLALFQSVGFTTAELFWRAHMQAGFYALKPT